MKESKIVQIGMDEIIEFRGNVAKCQEAEVRFHGEELKIYHERMTILQKAYNDLIVLSMRCVLL